MSMREPPDPLPLSALPVLITSTLRAAVETGTDAIRRMLSSAYMPPPVDDARCKQCSLIDLCQPHALTVLRAEERAHRKYLFDPEG